MLSVVVICIEKGFESRFIELIADIYIVNSDGISGLMVKTLAHTRVVYTFQNYTLIAPANSLLLLDKSYMFVIECDGGCANDNYLQFTRQIRDTRRRQYRKTSIVAP